MYWGVLPRRVFGCLAATSSWLTPPSYKANFASFSDHQLMCVHYGKRRVVVRALTGYMAGLGST